MASKKTAVAVAARCSPSRRVSASPVSLGRPPPHAQPDGHGFAVARDRSTRRRGPAVPDSGTMLKSPSWPASSASARTRSARPCRPSTTSGARSDNSPCRPDTGAARSGPGQGARREADLDEAKVTQALAEIRAAEQAEQAAALKERLDAAVAQRDLDPVPRPTRSPGGRRRA